MVVVGTVYSFILPFPTPLTPTPPKGCLMGGKLHPSGSSWAPSPCQSCDCWNGQPMCMTGDCAVPSSLCVDFLTYPGECCPVW